MDALFCQIKSELKKFNATSKSIESIFIGGGTPSTIDPRLYTKIFNYLQPYMIDNCEIIENRFKFHLKEGHFLSKQWGGVHSAANLKEKVLKVKNSFQAV